MKQFLSYLLKNGKISRNLIAKYSTWNHCWNKNLLSIKTVFFNRFIVPFGKKLPNYLLNQNTNWYASKLDKNPQRNGVMVTIFASYDNRRNHWDTKVFRWLDKLSTEIVGVKGLLTNNGSGGGTKCLGATALEIKAIILSKEKCFHLAFNGCYLIILNTGI